MFFELLKYASSKQVLSCLIFLTAVVWGGQETCTQRKSLMRENLQENLQYFLHVSIEEILKGATYG